MTDEKWPGPRGRERSMSLAQFEVFQQTQAKLKAEREAELAEVAALRSNLADVLEALEPFAKAAEKAHERMAEHGVSENASPGLGIKFKHLFHARSVLSRLKETT
jgi:hypothetical protein